MLKRVAVLGGGVGGLSAAHELVERGFAVEVFERKKILGGKARSFAVDPPPPYSSPPPDASSSPDASADSDSPEIPGEHGFRFFPGFYKHLFDTMRRIPYPDGTRAKKTVWDNLVTTKAVQIARKENSNVLLPVHFPDSVGHFYDFLEEMIPKNDVHYFFKRLVALLSSCEERRLTEYERQSWEQFVDVQGREKPVKFEKYLSGGLTRTLVAARADKISARTGGTILLQLLFDLARPSGQVDRVLNGPTNTVWIDPWKKYLSDKSVKFHVDHSIREIEFHPPSRRVTGILIEEAGGNGKTMRRRDFDFYVAALPVEVMRKLVTAEMKRADPSLAHLGSLETAWMSGVQYYLSKAHVQDPPDEIKKMLLKEEPVLASAPGEHVLGHSLYIDSEWALTSISQLPFWLSAGYTPPQVNGTSVDRILSVVASDWEKTKAERLGIAGKKATEDEVVHEVWMQLKEHLNDDKMKQLDDSDRLHSYLDPAIRQGPDGLLTNDEPLLVNTVSSWGARPEAVTAISNLFLAADYVRTNTDLATMESANEAARRAVNGILQASGHRGRRCRIWPLSEPWVFIPLRWYDRRRFRRGEPHDSRVSHFLARFVAVPSWQAMRYVWKIYRWLTYPFQKR